MDAHTEQTNPGLHIAQTQTPLALMLIAIDRQIAQKKTREEVHIFNVFILVVVVIILTLDSVSHLAWQL